MGNRKYSVDDWRAVRAALAEGLTVRAAAERTGVGRNAVFRWGRTDEPPERMWLAMEICAPCAPGPGRPPGSRLTYEDRRMVFAMRREGASCAEIAAAVGCHRTTVSRELARAGGGDYDPRLAQRDAEARARRWLRGPPLDS